MKIKTAITLSALMTIGLSSMTMTSVSEAGGFGPMNNMMNPSKWFGGNKNRRYDDDYYDGGPGYGYPPPGYGYGAPGGYGGYPGGYGAPGYGAPVQPGYAAPAAPAAPAASDTGSADRIKELEDRIRQLESSQRQPPMPPQGYGGGQPGSGGGGYPPPQQSGGYQGGGGGYPAPQSPAFRPTN